MTHDLLTEVQDALTHTAAEVVPWFTEQMPAAYFRDVDAVSRRTHLAALVGARATGLPPSLTLRSPDGDRWTMIRPRDRPGLLAQLLKELPTDRPLHDAQVHTARDQSLVLDVFSFGAPPPFDAADPEMADKLEVTLTWAAREAPDLEPDDVADAIRRMSRRAVLNLTPRRLTRFARLLRQVGDSDDVVVDAWMRSDGDDQGTVTVLAGRARPREVLERVAWLLGRHGLTVRRAYLDSLEGPDPVVACSFVVQGTGERVFRLQGPAWEELNRDLHRVLWLDERVIRSAADIEGMSLLHAEVLVALLDLVHVRLARQDRYAFSRQRLSTLAMAAVDVLTELAARFVDGGDVGTVIGEASLQADVRRVVEAVAAAVAAVRRSNVHHVGRYGLAMQLDPSFLLGAEHPSVPHAVIYGHGRAYRGFHIRFRPIARGGLRVVAPRALDQHTLETERLFDEVYGLSFAQQLKNKDIPEGGAKGVVLVAPGAELSGAVRAFTDGMLDLALEDPDDLLYLGPDENITPAMIEWIVQRAAARGYGQPLAFMSSKPGAGINHKEYGVTSEGVTVFLEAALRAHGIDPRTQDFTLKMTGGPDGDVAGNEIKILAREYGTHARFVGIADGSGCAEDPDGLDQDELLRLVALEAPIASFDPAKLGPRGAVVPLSASGGHARRNTLHNRLVADVFVPAGGRPRTIREDNHAAFLTEDGTPSSPIIVEGANIFLTPGARTALTAAGVSIIKDSSANKCGVICSSFEIVACMLLDEQTFLAIKDTFVAEVLDRLRDLARREADVLFRAARRQPDVPLPELSVRVSRAALRATDAVVAALPHMAPERRGMWESLVIEHLPPSLVAAAGPDLITRLPSAYVDQTIATVATMRLLYREGLDYLETLADAQLAEVVVDYLHADAAARTLADQLEATGTPQARTAAHLLRQGGARTALAWGLTARDETAEEITAPGPARRS